MPIHACAHALCVRASVCKHVSISIFVLGLFCVRYVSECVPVLCSTLVHVRVCWCVRAAPDSMCF